MGRQKLLLPYKESTVIRHIVGELVKSRVDPVVVVTGYDHERLVQALDGLQVRLVHNPDYPQGMITSIRCGLQAVPTSHAGFLVALGDQPALTAALVDRLIETFEQSGYGLVFPNFQGKKGHPVLVSGRYRNELASHYDDVGLRGLFQAHPDEVLALEVDEPWVTADMDTPTDYDREKWRARFQSPDGSGQESS